MKQRLLAAMTFLAVLAVEVGLGIGSFVLEGNNQKASYLLVLILWIVLVFPNMMFGTVHPSRPTCQWNQSKDGYYPSELLNLLLFSPVLLPLCMAIRAYRRYK